MTRDDSNSSASLIGWADAVDLVGSEAELESLVRFRHVHGEQRRGGFYIRSSELIAYLRKRRDKEIQRRARDYIEGSSAEPPTAGFEWWEDPAPKWEDPAPKRRARPAPLAALPPGCHVTCAACPQGNCPACPLLKGT